FADKTQFDFTHGITAIVGPNGSGKSNIVDAVRWVLGEQSAKSLRGGEMADVIFNGSTSRRSLGLAEVTMTFDNSRRTLLTEADEVQITRRVYRDGEGEYLINHQPSRPKDIKELRLGLGLQDFEQLTARLESEGQALADLHKGVTEQAGHVDVLEAGMRRLEESLAQVDEQLHKEEAELAQARQQIATHEATLSHEWSLSLQLEADLTRTRERVAELNGLVAALAEATAHAAAEMHEVDAHCQEQQRGLAQFEQEHHAAVQRLAELHNQVQADKAE